MANKLKLTASPHTFLPIKTYSYIQVHLHNIITFLDKTKNEMRPVSILPTESAHNSPSCPEYTMKFVASWISITYQLIPFRVPNLIHVKWVNSLSTMQPHFYTKSADSINVTKIWNSSSFKELYSQLKYI